jgi:hypothetical protein
LLTKLFMMPRLALLWKFKFLYPSQYDKILDFQIFISFPIWQNSWQAIKPRAWWRWLSSFVFQKPWPKDIRHVKVDNIRRTTKHFQFWVKMTFDALRHYKKLNT